MRTRKPLCWRAECIQVNHRQASCLKAACSISLEIRHWSMSCESISCSLSCRCLTQTAWFRVITVAVCLAATWIANGYNPTNICTRLSFTRSNSSVICNGKGKCCSIATCMVTVESKMLSFSVAPTRTTSRKAESKMRSSAPFLYCVATKILFFPLRAVHSGSRKPRNRLDVWSFLENSTSWTVLLWNVHSTEWAKQLFFRIMTIMVEKNSSPLDRWPCKTWLRAAPSWLQYLRTTCLENSTNCQQLVARFWHSSTTSSLNLCQPTSSRSKRKSSKYKRH